jgi:hypothetical protein
MTTHRIDLAALTLILLAAIATACLGFGPVAMRTDALTTVPQLFPPLVMVSLLIERTLEVFVTLWRDPGAEPLEKAVEASRAAAPGSAAVVEAQHRLDDYRSGTRRLAFSGGLVLGVIVSLVGVRALSFMVDGTALAQITTAQHRAFETVDVLITGLALGAGSDPLHQVLQAFTNFFDTSAQNAKARAPQP